MYPTNPNGYDYGEEGLSVCADCHTISPEFHDVNFAQIWADCPTCETITGVALDSRDLPNGKDFDHALFLRHFPESHTPALEEIVACILEELEVPVVDTPFDRWVSSGQCADDMAGDTDPAICQNCGAEEGECPSWCLFEQGLIDCPHEDYSETLTGAICNDCGLEHEEA